jgi:NADH-quinone oxidoreductase subunit L
MSKMGGLLKKMPITAWTMFIGLLAIGGIPLFSGWYSKDSIIAHALGFCYVHPEHTLLFLLPLITAGITAFYMFRMWFLTFTGEPRDHHVHEHARESPWVMTVPLMVLALFSIIVAWGWPAWDATKGKMEWDITKSDLEHTIHHAQHHSVISDFGYVPEHDRLPEGGVAKPVEQSERNWAHKHHDTGGYLALVVVCVGVAFSSLLYYSRVLDPAEGKEQFPATHRFLSNKWYFDELYSALIVRPALVLAGWCRAFDTYVIDGVVNFLGRFTVILSKWDGKFDLGIVDGLVNLTARVFYGVGAWLRNFQTGYIRSYILFLVLAVIGIFALLSYFVALATAG